MANNVDFKPFAFEDALAYHIVYHGSEGIHLNHLIFLHTYVLGVFLLSISISIQFSLVLLTLYIGYIMKMEYYLGVTYTTILFILYAMAYGIWSQIFASQSTYAIVASFILIIASFVCQLIGHRLYEKVQAAPNLWHGLWSAPFLEYSALIYRKRRRAKVFRDAFEEVDQKMREMRKRIDSSK